MVTGRREGPTGSAGDWDRLGDSTRDRVYRPNGARSRDRGGWQDGIIPSARPLLRPAPRSAMFFPLVVIIAVLPGLYALNSWDLTPPGPWWGLRSMAVLDGWVVDQTPAVSLIKPTREAEAFGLVASQPPLYAWLSAAGLALSSNNDPLAAVLTSYVAGAVVVVLVYLHGRLWRGPGLGLVAALLTGFNRSLLVQMQQATPTTLGLAGVLLSLYAYGRYLRSTTSSGGNLWAKGGPPTWAAVSGAGLAIALLSVGLFGLVVVPVVSLHQLYLRAGTSSRPVNTQSPVVIASVSGRERGQSLMRTWWAAGPALAAGLVTIGVAILLAAPWYLVAVQRHGWDVLTALLEPLDPITGARPGLLARLIRLAPATLALGVFAAGRSLRLALADETEDRATVGGAFWVLWLAVAAVLPAFWRSGPWHLGDLFLLVPLNLLAAQAVSDLAGRRVSVRALIWLAPITAVTVAWCFSANLRGAVDDVTHGRADAATALGLHLAFDLLIAAIWLTRRLDSWARRRDDRQRRVLAGYLVAILVVTILAGGRELWFRHRETDDLLMLRTMILRRDRERPFDFVAVLGPEARSGPDGPAPGGRLRFILRSALPRLEQHDVATADELVTLLDTRPARADGQILVVLAGTGQRLRHDVQSRLKLEAIHPGRAGVLDAFATVAEASRQVQ